MARKKKPEVVTKIDSEVFHRKGKPNDDCQARTVSPYGMHSYSLFGGAVHLMREVEGRTQVSVHAFVKESWHKLMTVVLQVPNHEGEGTTTYVIHVPRDGGKPIDMQRRGTLPNGDAVHYVLGETGELVNVSEEERQEEAKKAQGGGQ